MAKLLAKVGVDSVVDQLDVLIQDSNLLALQKVAPLRRTFKLAGALRQMRDLITDEMMSDVMALQGTTIGFRTDKVYSVDVVKRVAIEAMLRGLHMLDNEVNIIAGNLYVAKNGCYRLVKSWPGLTNFLFDTSIPITKTGGAVVEAWASWKLNGEEHRLEKRNEMAIPVKVPDGY